MPYTFTAYLDGSTWTVHVNAAGLVGGAVNSAGQHASPAQRAELGYGARGTASRDYKPA